MTPDGRDDHGERAVSLMAVASAWGRIGCLGFGGPPTHIVMLRELCVTGQRWMSGSDFDDAVVACNLLPGPASTQLSMYCAWRVRGRIGALVGGVAFIAPGLAIVLALSALFLGSAPPSWIAGAGAGAGAAVAAVAAHAAVQLLRPSWQRCEPQARVRWVLYVASGTFAAANVRTYLVFVLLACGAAEVAIRTVRSGGRTTVCALSIGRAAAIPCAGLTALSWTAFKVGALAYGGGFVIIPLMQADAIRNHWMTATQFLNAVALGQVTPGPVTQTVAAVGYAAAGIRGGLLAATVAFAPSFAFIMIGGKQFDRLRQHRGARDFFQGAGPAAIGAILGSSIPLVRALHEPWQFATLAAAAIAVFVARRKIVPVLLGAALVGAAIALAGGMIPR